MLTHFEDWTKGTTENCDCSSEHIEFANVGMGSRGGLKLVRTDSLDHNIRHIEADSSDGENLRNFAGEVEGTGNLPRLFFVVKQFRA